ncbi:hypothetical protein GWK47_026650 [Chionoecetes opilio]|uniref:Uncharacterized protein n=1 Tax=Chionoecetes opilio TaxID=41210 RepID=A0A8J8WA43_CHIOP|nr:hypothetical protein GWK47_026650 [Chionoecetes opilio]
MHQARWMAKILYSLKIRMFRDQVHDLTKWEEKCTRNVALFAVTVYMKPWFATSLAAAALGLTWIFCRSADLPRPPDRESVFGQAGEQPVVPIGGAGVLSLLRQGVPPETKRALVQA